MEFFTYSPTLDRCFTFNEWCDYCNSHPTVTEVIISYNGFDFNVYGICINPKTDKRNCEYYDIEIYTAQSPCGLWSYGFNFSIDNNCHSVSPQYISSVKDTVHGFETERDATLAALAYAKEFGARYADNEHAKEFLSDIAQWNVKQGELF